MVHYIDKDALVAEIERILLIYTKRYDELAKYEVWATAKEIKHRIQGLKEVLSILNTIEVKGVDLDKEIDEHWDNWAKEDGFHFIDFAKYFYELGLKTQTEE